MLPANAMGSGMEIHATNVMATPVGVPVVGVNNAMNAMRAPPCPTILLTCQPALNMGSIAPVTVSIPAMIPPCLPSNHLMGYPTVIMQGLPATQLTSPSLGNGGCAPLGATLVPNVTNVFYGLVRSDAPTDLERATMTLDDLRALDRALDGPIVESQLSEGGVGSLRVRRFSSRVPSVAFHALRDLTRRGMTSLLVDLRGNGGGEVDSFVRLAGDFLEDGAVIVTMTDPEGDEVVRRARQSRDYALPVAIMVDADTASAAEAFAGALQAHRRAVVVGQRTYGKGEAQMVVTMPDGAPVYATVARLTLPDGRPLQGRGVEPDWPVVRGEQATQCEASERLPPALRDAVVRHFRRRAK